MRENALSRARTGVVVIGDRRAENEATARATVSGSRVSRSRRHTLWHPLGAVVPIVMARMPVTFLSGSFAVTVEKTPPLKKSLPPSRPTSLRRTFVGRRSRDGSLRALITRRTRTLRARARGRTHERNPPAYPPYTYTATSSRRSSVRRARVCACVCVCARSLLFFRPTANFFRAFDFRSAFPACVAPRYADALRCASAVVRQPRLLKTDGGGGWCHPRLISAGRAAKYARVGITFLRRHANPTAYTVRRSFTRCAH